MAQIISINAGKPKTFDWKGELVTTSIWKEPVQGTINVNYLNLEGDLQSDLKVHGGPDKAVYAYPGEHYKFWAQELEQDLPWGSFGENLTTNGLNERDVRVGDKFQIGSALFQVTQPRFPCYKLGLKFNDARMVRRFVQSRRNGFYLRILEEGAFRPGDAIGLVEKSQSGILIRDFISLYLGEEKEPGLTAKAIGSPGLPKNWIEFFLKIPNGKNNEPG